MTAGRIDITCSLPAPTLAQVREWLTRTGWTECQDSKSIWPVPRWTPPGSPGHAVYIYDIAFASSETLQDIARALGEPHTPEAVYREIVGATKVWLVLGHCHTSGVIGAHASPESAQREMETYTAPPLLKREASIEECEVLP